MLEFLLLLAGGLMTCNVLADNHKPNIVFLLTDDQGWNALSIPADPNIPGSGSSFYQTPHTSRLAEEGIRFSMAYSASPTCGPSITSIQYGQTPTSLGKFAELIPTNLPPHSDAMVRLIKKKHPEYRAAHFGKWHQRTRTPEEIGYDVSDGQTMNAEGNSDNRLDPKLTFSLAKKAVNFMDEQVKDSKPFFMQVSFYANHLKYQALPETVKKYEFLSVNSTEYHNSGLWAAMNEDMDTAVGQILKKLDDLGIRENTYVIYTADNGYEFKRDTNKPVEQRSFYKSHPLKSHKYTINEGGLRVPFIVRGPGIPAGVSSREPVVAWDILPTVLDMIGAEELTPQNVEGGSILATCQSAGKEKVTRKVPYLVFRYTKLFGALDVSIIQDGYKYLREIRSGKEHLWNLWQDLGEDNNLINQMPEKAVALRKKMNDYFKKHDWNQQEHINAKRTRSNKKRKK